MSSGISALLPTSEDIANLLAAEAHLGAVSVDYRVAPYIYGRRSDGVNIFDLHKTHEKILLAARAIVAIENPADVCAISTAAIGQRAVLKFSAHTGSSVIAGRFTPGSFTNQITKKFQEPRLIVTTDPRADHQAILESSYVGIPVISLVNADNGLEHVDIAIPCNNKGKFSVGLIWWMLAREVLRMRGTVSRTAPWGVMPDLYFYRNLEEDRRDQPEQQLHNHGNVAPVVAATSGAPPVAVSVVSPEVVSGAPVQDWNATENTNWNAGQAH